MKKRMTGWLTILLLLCVAAVPVRAEESVSTKSIDHVSDLNSPDVKLGLPSVSSADIAVQDLTKMGDIVRSREQILKGVKREDNL